MKDYTSTKKYIKRDNSKDEIRAYSYSKSHQTVFPDFDFSKAEEMINSDPVARGVLNHFVDKCMEGSYSIYNTKTLSGLLEQKQKLEQRFMFSTKVLAKSFRMAKLYNNVFLELIQDSNGAYTDLNVLDSANIEPITEPNGDPIGYKTRSVPDGQDAPYWSKDEVIWLKFGDMSRGYAPVDMQALFKNLLTKEYTIRFLSWLWKTGQYRLIYNFKAGTNSKDINDFLAMGRKLDFDFTRPSIYKGDVEKTVSRDMNELGPAKEWLDYLDQQTIIHMRVPGIDAGFMNSGSRSDADAAKSALATHVKSYKSIIASYINHELLPKMKRGDQTLVFSPTDRLEARTVFDNLMVMSNVGLSDRAKQEYLVQHGIVFDGDEWFMQPEEQGGNTSVTGQALGAPSRQGKSEEQSNSRIGTGEDATTRQDQLNEE